VKAGFYSPQSDDLEDWDEGFNGELAFGHYFNPNVAMEFGLGYFQTETSQPDAEITVIPVTLALKGIYPVDKAELYVLGGIGAYFANLEVSGRGLSIDDDDTAFGGFQGAGVNYKLSNEFFIGVEAKYLWVEAEWSFANVDLDGWIFTGNLGFRF